MSADRAFIDSNIIVYLAGDGGKALVAMDIVRHGGVISVQVLNETANVLRKKAGLAISDIRDFLGLLRTLLDVTPVTIELHEAGLDLAERHELSVYDAMILAAARQAGCGVLLTENMASGAVLSGIHLVNPFKDER